MRNDKCEKTALAWWEITTKITNGAYLSAKKITNGAGFVRKKTTKIKNGAGFARNDDKDEERCVLGAQVRHVPGAKS